MNMKIFWSVAGMVSVLCLCVLLSLQFLRNRQSDPQNQEKSETTKPAIGELENGNTPENENTPESGNALENGNTPESGNALESGSEPAGGSETYSMMALAESEEEAVRIAELYGVTFIEYSYGVATYETEKDPNELIEFGKRNQYPAIEINNLNYLD